jgi:hypothetical protein
MTEINSPHTRLVVRRQVTKDNADVLYETQDSEVPMSEEQKDAYHQVIGDANAKVTYSREVKIGKYGTMCGAFASVSLTCHQSEAHINYALGLAKTLVETRLESDLPELEAKAVQLIQRYP